MRGKEFFFLAFALSICILSNAAALQNNSNGSITGKVTSQPFNLAIQVVPFYPDVFLYSPKNNTYWTTSILLNYTTSDASKITYTLDNGPNITITGPTIFTASAGSHIFWLYVNSTQGTLVARNQNFTVDLNKPYINYTNYSDSGASTDFGKYSFEELQNLSTVVFEKISYGSIKFTGAVNVTDTHGIGVNNIIDLNPYIVVSPNSVYINSTALPNFNKSATIAIRGLAFSNPKILRDGVDCPASDCIFQSYLGGTLTFNVSHFSTYSVTEGPSSGGNGGESSGSSGGSGGGGGSGPSTYLSTKKVDIISDKVVLSMKQGETRRAEFIVQSEERNDLNLTFEVVGGDDFILLQQTSLVLRAGETQSVPFDVLIRENTVPDVYIKQIIVRENGREIGRANLVVDVSSKKSLFDVKLSLINTKIRTSDPLIAEVELYNFGDTGRVDTQIDYIIKDVNNVEMYREHDTAAVETQLNLVKVIKVNDLPEGSYILYVKSTYDNNVASTSQWFAIENKGINYNLWITVALVTIIILMIYFRLRVRKEESWFDKLEDRVRESILKRRVEKAIKKSHVEPQPKPVKELPPIEKKKMARLQQQLKQLEYVHSKGLVDENEYQTTKSDIQSEMNDLNNRR